MTLYNAGIFQKWTGKLLEQSNQINLKMVLGVIKSYTIGLFQLFQFFVYIFFKSLN